MTGLKSDLRVEPDIQKSIIAVFFKLRPKRPAPTWSDHGVNDFWCVWGKRNYFFIPIVDFNRTEAQENAESAPTLLLVT
jgi:hypothetical protein